METVLGRIYRLAGLERRELINDLVQMDRQAQEIYRRGRLARLNTPERYYSQEALRDSESLGRIISFVRTRTPARNTTKAESALCGVLAEELKAKGQWDGDFGAEALAK